MSAAATERARLKTRAVKTSATRSFIANLLWDSKAAEADRDCTTDCLPSAVLCAAGICNSYWADRWKRLAPNARMLYKRATQKGRRDDEAGRIFSGRGCGRD